jgi:hypothetical protein
MSTLKSTWDRRELIAAAIGAATVAYLPFDSSRAAPAVGATHVRDVLADWSIDDQWGVWPRWDAIPCAPARQDAEPRWANVQPVDLPFLV